MKQNAKILIRMRPLLSFEDQPAWITNSTSIKCMHSKSVRAKINKGTNLSSITPHLCTYGVYTANASSNSKEFQPYEFQFQKVLENTTSQKIYRNEIKKIVYQSLTQSRNSTVVAYGQTCSGKTYTLLGVKQAPGFIPCIFRDIFHGSYQNNSKSYRYIFKISYIQIYNQTLIDLLSQSQSQPQQRPKLKISADPEWGIQVQNTVKKQVSSFEDCLDVLDLGQANRKYGEKLNHQRSSRSHTIIKIYVEKWDQNMGRMRSVINVVDLAGSQRLSIENNSYQNSTQTSFINKSLFQFSNIISKLTQSQHNQHIPYRDSKLTRLLQNSLTKNCNLAIVFCISPAVMNFGETVSTLRLATKAKKVQIDNLIQVKQQFQISRLKVIIKQQERQIKELKQKINKLNIQISKINQDKILRQKYTNLQQIQSRNIVNTSQMNIKALILLDHQNFLLSPNPNIKNALDPSQLTPIKQQFLKGLQIMYQQYIRKIIKASANKSKEMRMNQKVNAELDQDWLKIEQICFINLLFNREAILEARLHALAEVINQLGDGDYQFKAILSKYMMQIKTKVGAVAKTKRKNYGDDKDINDTQYSKHSTKNLTAKSKSKQKRYKNQQKFFIQSPIFQQQTIQLSQNNNTTSYSDCKKNNKKQIGSRIVAWGCRKDYRVFKDQKNKSKQSNNNNINQIIAQLSDTKYGNLVQVACGAHHSFILNDSGQAYGWGKNEYNQIIASKNSAIPLPKLIPISKSIKIKQIAAGWGHSLLLSQEGSIFSFGFGEDGQLGHGDWKSICEPTKIQTENAVQCIYAGHSHSGYIDTHENYYAFGFNKDYRLMIAESKQVNSPHRVNLKGIIKAALGVTHSCLLTRNGKVYCGGVGTNGQLGIQLNPSITGYELMSAPQKSFSQNSMQKICPMVQLQLQLYRPDQQISVIDISCGQCCTAIITQKNELYTFGKSSFDRLGHNQPGINKILSGVNRVQMGYRHGFAWNADKDNNNDGKGNNKEIYAWGFNMYNQLGSLEPKDLRKPELMQLLSNRDVVSVSTGFFHSCAIAK